MIDSRNEVLISAYAIAKILAVDSIDPSKESAGVLLGYLDENQNLIITDFDTGKQQQTATFVVMDDSALVQIVEDLQSRGKKESIVGWAHTHPSYGCFLSGTDKGTQRIYQNLFPEAVALVIDPSRYYQSSKQTDLEIKFFRLLDDVDYQAVPFRIYFDNISTHLSNLVEANIKWAIPKLSKEEVSILHRKLNAVSSPTLSETDKNLLHAFVDVFNKTKEEEVEEQPDKEVLKSIDQKLVLISEDVERIYNEETSNIYATLNVIAALIISITWVIIAFLL
ncbi:MAG: hypothetical protein ACTSSG_01845 [Candidatus Heimdallarchaeaceae archaeon]